MKRPVYVGDQKLVLAVTAPLQVTLHFTSRFYFHDRCYSLYNQQPEQCTRISHRNQLLSRHGACSG